MTCSVTSHPSSSGTEGFLGHETLSVKVEMFGRCKT